MLALIVTDDIYGLTTLMVLLYTDIEGVRFMVVIYNSRNMFSNVLFQNGHIDVTTRQSSVSHLSGHVNISSVAFHQNIWCDGRNKSHVCEDFKVVI